MSDSWDPMDCSPPDSSVCGIFQARRLGSVAISSSSICVCVYIYIYIHICISVGFSRQEDWSRLPFPPPVNGQKWKLLSCVQLFVTPWTIACQAPLSMKFYRQEYWSGLPWLSPGIFLTQGSNPGLSHCRQILYHLSYSGILVNGQSQNPNLGLLHCQNVSYSLLLCCLPRALLNAKCQPWFWDGGSQNNLPPPPNMCIS